MNLLYPSDRLESTQTLRTYYNNSYLIIILKYCLCGHVKTIDDTLIPERRWTWRNVCGH